MHIEYIFILFIVMIICLHLLYSLYRIYDIFFNHTKLFLYRVIQLSRAPFIFLRVTSLSTLLFQGNFFTCFCDLYQSDNRGLVHSYSILTPKFSANSLLLTTHGFGSFLINLAAFRPIICTGAVLFPSCKTGVIERSATLRFLVPKTLRNPSTTPS